MNLYKANNLYFVSFFSDMGSGYVGKGCLTCRAYMANMLENLCQQVGDIGRERWRYIANKSDV